MTGASYPVLSITRQDLVNAGVARQYVDLLTDDEVQAIAAQVGEVIAVNTGFKKLVFVVTWSLILNSDLFALFDKSE